MCHLQSRIVVPNHDDMAWACLVSFSLNDIETTLGLTPLSGELVK